MKKKVKQLVDWFYQETDRGAENVASCKNIYDMVERLQYRLEGLENEHMILLREIAELKTKLESL